MNNYQKTIDTYNKIARQFKETRNNDFWEEDFELFKKFLPKGRVIDIGCGTGRDSLLFLKSEYDYLGIDPSEKMIEQAKEFSPKAKFEVMSIDNMNFEENSFDGFWSVTSLLHIPKKEINEAISKIKKIVRNGGMGFISLKPIGEKVDFEEGIIKEYREELGGEVERFFAFYSQEEFKDILEKNNFEVVKNYIKNKANKNWLCYIVRNNKK